MVIKYNPLNVIYKNPVGAAKAGEKITFRVQTDNSLCELDICRDGEGSSRYPMIKKGDFFEVEITLKSGLYFYFFDFKNGLRGGRSKDYLAEITLKPTPFQLTVYDADYKVPELLKGGIIYQIFPDRFCRSEIKTVKQGKYLHDDLTETPVFLPDEFGEVLNNDFFGGDFKGIIQKLDYLESLGVTAIYLNPIFEAYSNHRYDTGDYMKIDELLGTEEDFKDLICKAKEKGISIILDGVFNHTGIDSVYFNRYGNYDSVGAYQSYDSPYRKWFNFTRYPDDYESWWGIKTLPSVNKLPDSGYIKFITEENGVIDKYIKLGAAGFRLDVVDELPSHFVKTIRKTLKKANPDAILIGEVWEDPTNKVSYGARREYFQGKELDSVMNYPLKNAILSFVQRGDESLSYIIKEQIDHFPKTALDSLMNILSTHDTYRLVSALCGIDASKMTKEEMSHIVLTGEKLDRAIEKVKAAAVLQFTLYGVPCIYYGDEVGMQGFSDPLNRKFFPWGNENKDLLAFYRKLGKIRRENSVFNNGETEILCETDGVIMYKRFNENDEIIVAENFGKFSKKLEFKGKIKDLLSGKTFDGCIDFPRGSVLILKK